MQRKGTYMSTILKGAPVVAAMNEANAARCAALREKGVVPTLAVVRVGAREDDLSYEKGVMARCAKVGVEVKQFLLPADASQEELLRVIAGINADAAIHGWVEGYGDGTSSAPCPNSLMTGPSAPHSRPKRTLTASPTARWPVSSPTLPSATRPARRRPVLRS